MVIFDRWLRPVLPHCLETDKNGSLVQPSIYEHVHTEVSLMLTSLDLLPEKLKMGWESSVTKMLQNVINKYGMGIETTILNTSTLTAEMKRILDERSGLEKVRDELNNVLSIYDFRKSKIIHNTFLFSL